MLRNCRNGHPSDRTPSGECRACVIGSQKRYRERHPGRKLASGRKYRQNNLEKSREASRNVDFAMKESAINMYSNGTQMCAQPGCGQCDIDVLVIDHIHNDGNVQRETRHPMGGSTLYRWLRQHDYPEGFQVLCCNCNLKKHLEFNRATRAARIAA